MQSEFRAGRAQTGQRPGRDRWAGGAGRASSPHGGFFGDHGPGVPGCFTDRGSGLVKRHSPAGSRRILMIMTTVLVATVVTSFLVVADYAGFSLSGLPERAEARASSPVAADFNPVSTGWELAEAQLGLR